jgi:ankyrin repeat protein
MKRDREAMTQYDRAMSALQLGSAASLEQLEQFEGFPHGVDPYIGRRWIINAIDIGSLASIRWILERGVDLNFRDEEGYTPIHSVIDRARDDKIEVLTLLLEAGAPVDLKGINDWTPAHLAAARDDVESLRVLVKHGADLTIRTEIDDYATPLEEARNLGKLNAVRFLEGAA